jgi:hypothetical protein
MDNLLIAIRRDKTEILGGAHAIAADRCTHRYKWLGIPAAILSTIVGATTLAGFIDFGPEHHIAKLVLDIVLCVLAITVAVLTTLQTFLDYPAHGPKSTLMRPRGYLHWAAPGSITSTLTPH